eukprot:TRINITY_DN23517_c0_g1_i1.p1 TRINITY_DN23517_c0_g1~~TRINITY_DN23517_c0_g1_i1.p1  ORF type:complete len:151 (-),score=31.01 TRINITY_DN23517_c0_g1_i1:1-453(-)
MVAFEISFSIRFFYWLEFLLNLLKLVVNIYYSLYVWVRYGVVGWMMRGIPPPADTTPPFQVDYAHFTPLLSFAQWLCGLAKRVALVWLCVCLLPLDLLLKSQLMKWPLEFLKSGYYLTKHLLITLTSLAQQIILGNLLFLRSLLAKLSLF